MKAVCIHGFGGVEAIVVEEAPPPPEQARPAHEMLAGRPDRRGKIVRAVDA